MIGLLYQDFLRVKGNWIILIMFGQFLLFVLIEIFVFNAPISAYILGVLLMSAMILTFLFIGGYLELALMKGSNTQKNVRYYLSLPLSKQDYVAEKYIFLILAMWFVSAVFTFEMLMVRLASTEIVPEEILEASGNTAGISAASLINILIPTIFYFMISFTLFICAVELPFYFRFGADKGKVIKSTLIVLLAFAVFVYAMFGDLTVFDHWNIFHLMEYLEAHPDISFAISVLPFVFCGLLYWGSYRLSVRLFMKKEGFEDET